MNGGILILLALRHYGYYHLPEWMQGDFFALCASGLILIFLIASDVWFPIKAWAAGEELLSLACTSAYIISPYVIEGGEKCSSIVGFKIGAIGLVVLAFAVWRVTVKSVSVANSQESSK